MIRLITLNIFIHSKGIGWNKKVDSGNSNQAVLTALSYVLLRMKGKYYSLPIPIHGYDTRTNGIDVVLYNSRLVIHCVIARYYHPFFMLKRPFWGKFM